MSLTRRQIGAEWSFSNNSSSTTIQLPSRTIQRGSLVKAFFRYESENLGLTVTDSAGGVWRVERHFQTNINVAIAWCWNHPGGENVVITGTLASSQSYRYASAVEETGGDVVDPAIPESVIKTYAGPADGLRHWVASDPLADTAHASGAYNYTIFAALPEQTVVYTSNYLYSTCIRGINSTRRFAHHYVTSGGGSSIAHLSMAFRAPEAEYVALAKRRIWVPVSTGGGTSYSLTADVGSYSLTGQDAAFTYVPGAANYTLTADAGSYSLSGQDAALSYSPGSGAYSLTAEHGTYSLSGVDASTIAGRNLAGAFGSYSIAGQDASINVARNLSGEVGNYSLTGQNATLTFTGAVAYTLTAEYGTYSIGGQAANLVGPSTGFVDTHDGFWARQWAKAAEQAKRKETIEELEEELEEIEEQIEEVKAAPVAKKPIVVQSVKMPPIEAQAKLIETLIAKAQKIRAEIEEEEDILLLL